MYSRFLVMCFIISRWPRASNVPLLQRKPVVPGVHQSKAVPAAEGGDPALEGPQLECSAQLCAPEHRAHMDTVQRVQKGATNMSKGQEQRLTAGTVEPAEQKSSGHNLSKVYKHLTESAKVMETGCIPFQGQRWWAQTKIKRFHPNIRTQLFTVRVTEPWHRLHREVVESPFLVISKITWTLSWATGPRPDNCQRSLPPSTLLWFALWRKFTCDRPQQCNENFCHHFWCINTTGKQGNTPQLLSHPAQQLTLGLRLHPVPGVLFCFAIT